MSIHRESFGRISEIETHPLQYYQLIRQLNVLLQQELSQKLDKSLWPFSNVVTFVTAGSDARLEKGSLASPLEVIALVNADVDLSVFKESLTSILKEEFAGQISNIVEVKGLHSSMVNYQDYPSRKQPGRIGDARLIVGKQQDVVNAKQKLGEEIISMPARGVEKVAGLSRDALHATETGRNRIHGVDVIHFDLETGVVYFNPDAQQLSFKIGPLRLVQNKLLVEEVRHVRREKDASFFTHLASGVRDRLSQLKEDKMLDLTRQTVKELQEHYAFFLRLYHRSEQLYHLNHDVALQLTPSEVEEVARRLQALTEITGRLKIQNS